MLSTRKCFWFVHDTADGMVHSKVERQRRKWIARHWGDQLDGMRVCASLRDANEYLVTSFQEMFPEHRCTERCELYRCDSQSKKKQKMDSRTTRDEC